jgi:hypothetical protein
MLELMAVNSKETPTKKTTKEHFDKCESKYNAMKAAGINLESQCLAIFAKVKDPIALMGDMLKLDNALNNIPLKKFDAFFPMNLQIMRSLSLADNCCVLKHTIAFKLVKAKLVIED